MRVVVAEDAALFREGLIRLLGEAGFALVGQAADVPSLMSAVVEQRPQVALIAFVCHPAFKVKAWPRHLTSRGALWRSASSSFRSTLRRTTRAPAPAR